MLITIRKYLILPTAILLFFACSGSFESIIPDAPVYLERNTNTEAMELRTIGGFKTYTQAEQYGEAVGFGGLVIIYGWDEKFYAFDLACPNEVKRDVRVVPNSAGQAVCDSCGSVFSIGYGSGNRLSGQAKEGLRRYQVSTFQSVSGLFVRVTR